MGLEIFALFLAWLFQPPEVESGVGWLAPKNISAPVYPKKLAEQGYAGKVRFYLGVDRSGAVLGTRIVESSHPDFAQSIKQATAQWTFEPWAVPEPQPLKTEVMILALFGSRGLEPFSTDITVGLQNTLCAYLNHEVAHSRSEYPEASLLDVDVFAYTAEFLSSPFVALLVPDKRARADLLKEMKKSIPHVIAECAANSERRYVEFMPGKVRAILGG